jgi:hypothetical protein
MTELARLITLYRARASASAKFKLDVLMDLEQMRDSAVVPFLLEVLEDRCEMDEVRIHLVKRLRSRNGFAVPADRPLLAKAVGKVLADESNVQLRLQAALTLGHFIEIDGVLSRLSAVSLARDESIDLRYAAFTSVERAGPTPESIVVMRQITSDETLGDAARSVLSAWHTPHDRRKAQ